MRKGQNAIHSLYNPHQTAQDIADRFVDFLNTFHSYREPYDDEMDAWLHECYAQAIRNQPRYDFKTYPFFSPSSANADSRELYEKLRGARPDVEHVKPYQRRWTAIGTAIGGAIQREILLAERHYERLTGERPPFRFERDDRGFPMFEDFAKRMDLFEYDGERFTLFGTCDGILLYDDPALGTIRVGLEIKSKQTTYGQTSAYSLKHAKEDHVKQVVCYGMMYEVDYYVILYVNASKKAWEMTDEECAKYPDIKAFGVYIDDAAQQEVLQKFADVVKAVKQGTPPPPDLSKWAFNKYKTAVAMSLTDDEMEALRKQVERVKHSSLPAWLVSAQMQALEQIEEIRRKR